MLSLDLLHEADEVGRQGAREPIHVDQGDVPQSALDVSDIGPVDARIPTGR